MTPPLSVHQPLQPGDPTMVAGYRILARLGAGGMGRVFLGATQTGRRLAVKVIRPEFVDNPDFRQRFRQEVEAAQRVQSPFTAPLLDADPDGPMPWLATAYVPGPSLAVAVIENGPLPLRSLSVLLTGVAEALSAIHRAGIVHRDLKPSNVLLAEDGPKVIDFGIARAADATPLTRTGVRIGTPQFMAPEQALGRSATPAIDVFAFGSLAYFAATGGTPFGDGPDSAVLYRIVHEEPGLDGCPGELRALLSRCLDKDPEVRPDVSELLTALASLPGPESGWLPDPVTASLPAYSAPPPPPTISRTPATPPPTAPDTGRARTGLPVLAGAVAVAAIASAAVTVALTGGDDPGPAAAPSPSPPAVTSVIGAVQSPDPSATETPTPSPTSTVPAGGIVTTGKPVLLRTLTPSGDALITGSWKSNAKSYPDSLGTGGECDGENPTRTVFPLNGEYRGFVSDVAVTDDLTGSYDRGQTAVFKVYLDADGDKRPDNGEELASRAAQWRKPGTIEADVTGGTDLILEVSSDSACIPKDSFWGTARLYR